MASNMAAASEFQKVANARVQNKIRTQRSRSEKTARKQKKKHRKFSKDHISNMASNMAKSVFDILEGGFDNQCGGKSDGPDEHGTKHQNNFWQQVQFEISKNSKK